MLRIERIWTGDCSYLAVEKKISPCGSKWRIRTLSRLAPDEQPWSAQITGSVVKGLNWSARLPGLELWTPVWQAARRPEVKIGEGRLQNGRPTRTRPRSWSGWWRTAAATAKIFWKWGRVLNGGPLEKISWQQLVTYKTSIMRHIPNRSIF